ncbi:MAG: hypothetical protein RR876_11205 [Acinetobacter sp.]|uniref:hypothetical protein n=1 Tax=Acinetobacter sp. TaxID=472 RepID=UPI002FCA9396
MEHRQIQFLNPKKQASFETMKHAALIIDNRSIFPKINLSAQPAHLITLWKFSSAFF